MFDIHSLSAFTCGFATAWFVIFACILLSKKGRTRLQTILGWSLCYWAFSTLKDLVLTQPGLYNMEVNTIILFLDGFSSITYVLVLFELAAPGWVTLKRIVYLALPFIGFFVANMLYPSEVLMNIYVAFLLVFGFTVWGMGYVRIRKYETYLRNNYSNLENMNLSWLNPIFILIFVSEIQWLVVSLMFTPIADAIYYLLAVAVWQITLHYTRDLKQVKPEEAVPNVIPPPVTNSEPKTYPFADVIEKVIIDDGLYLDPTLSLNMLAARLGTNRTYLSDYFNNVEHVAFYDYINKLRIEKKSLPMLAEHPEFTLEYIALQSGFNSISTFRRAFKKYTGKVPRDFCKS